jgi:putative membrane protein
METLHLKYIVGALVYSGLGILILVLSFWLIEKLSPENLRSEILVRKNNALAIIAAAFMISVAIIIASAIHG